ncbi:hypothetical protein [Amycolatopsis orientalis]|uniref:hypothetical protein n=1 Tax=Amycolatopsis orientalis TaxID=31958 RepID=UPI0003F673EB|nr:hypothetical protein [Amycolatopsis orientalis]RXS77843.1 hypothetical protein ETR37_18860 [Geobacillus sp. PK12]
MTSSLDLNSTWGAITETGPWQVPPLINATSTMGSITLDFTAAHCPHDEVEVHVNCQAGRIVLVVPDGWTVLTSEVSASGAGIRTTLGSPPRPGKPRLRITGQVTWGRLEITDRADHQSRTKK